MIVIDDVPSVHAGWVDKFARAASAYPWINFKRLLAIATFQAGVVLGIKAMADVT